MRCRSEEVGSVGEAAGEWEEVTLIPSAAIFPGFPDGGGPRLMPPSMRRPSHTWDTVTRTMAAVPITLEQHPTTRPTDTIHDRMSVTTHGVALGTQSDLMQGLSPSTEVTPQGPH